MNVHAPETRAFDPVSPSSTGCWIISGRTASCPAAADSIFVGDGDFRAIGAEFLRHFVDFGRPAPQPPRAGCGQRHRAHGRSAHAVPAPERGSYEGFDPVLDGVAWCATTITPAYPKFRFQKLDIAHALYNPGGVVAGTDLVLPYGDANFDFRHHGLGGDPPAGG